MGKIKPAGRGESQCWVEPKKLEGTNLRALSYSTFKNTLRFDTKPKCDKIQTLSKNVIAIFLNH